MARVGWALQNALEKGLLPDDATLLQLVQDRNSAVYGQPVRGLAWPEEPLRPVLISAPAVPTCWMTPVHALPTVALYRGHCQTQRWPLLITKLLWRAHPCGNTGDLMLRREVASMQGGCHRLAWHASPASTRLSWMPCCAHCWSSSASTTAPSWGERAPPGSAPFDRTFSDCFFGEGQMQALSLCMMAEG